jgi:hypothetical protein
VPHALHCDANLVAHSRVRCFLRSAMSACDFVFAISTAQHTAMLQSEALCSGAVAALVWVTHAHDLQRVLVKAQIPKLHTLAGYKKFPCSNRHCEHMHTNEHDAVATLFRIQLQHSCKGVTGTHTTASWFHDPFGNVTKFSLHTQGQSQ